MKIDMNIDTQLKNVCNKAKANLYQRMHQTRKEFSRLSLLIELPIAVVTVASRIALIIENVLKGLANTLQGICTGNSEKIKIGAKQLFLGTGKNTVLLPYTVAVAIYDFFTSFYHALFGDIKAHSLKQCHKYDPTEKTAHEKTAHEKTSHEKSIDDVLKSEKKSDLPANQKIIPDEEGDCYKILAQQSQDSYVEPKSIYDLALRFNKALPEGYHHKEYLPLIEKAAILGYEPAVALFAPIKEAREKKIAELQREAEEFEERQEQKDSFNVLLKQSNEPNPDPQCIFDLAQRYDQGLGVSANKFMYEKHLEKAATLGHEPAVELFKPIKEAREQRAEQQANLAKEAKELEAAEKVERLRAEKLYYEDVEKELKDPNNRDKGKTYYKMAKCFEEGKGRLQDDHAGWYWLKSAAFLFNETAIKEFVNHRSTTVEFVRKLLIELNTF